MESTRLTGKRHMCTVKAGAQPCLDGRGSGFDPRPSLLLECTRLTNGVKQSAAMFHSW